MVVSSKYFIGFCFFKNSVQLISLQKHTGNCFSAETMHHEGTACVNQGHSDLDDQVAILTQHQLIVSTPSETSFYFGRRVVDSASFGENLRENRDRQHIKLLADYFSGDNQCFTENSEQTFRLLSLTTSSTFSSDCISFN